MPVPIARQVRIGTVTKEGLVRHAIARTVPFDRPPAPQAVEGRQLSNGISLNGPVTMEVTAANNRW
jgi:hypothetical protein